MWHASARPICTAAPASLWLPALRPSSPRITTEVGALPLRWTGLEARTGFVSALRARRGEVRRSTTTARTARKMKKYSRARNAAFSTSRTNGLTGSPSPTPPGSPAPELEHRSPDRDPVPFPELMLAGHRCVVHHRAVRRPEVREEIGPVAAPDLGVASGSAGIGEHHVAVGQAPNRHQVAVQRIAGRWPSALQQHQLDRPRAHRSHLGRGPGVRPLCERGLAAELALRQPPVGLELHLGGPDQLPPALAGPVADQLAELLHQGLLGVLEPFVVRRRHPEHVAVRDPDPADPHGLSGLHLPQQASAELHRLEGGAEGLGEEPLDQAFQTTLEIAKDAHSDAVSAGRTAIRAIISSPSRPEPQARCAAGRRLGEPERPLLPWVSRSGEWRNGRRAGFRTLWAQARGGSSPLSPTGLSPVPS